VRGSIAPEPVKAAQFRLCQEVGNEETQTETFVALRLKSRIGVGGHPSICVRQALAATGFEVIVAFRESHIRFSLSSRVRFRKPCSHTVATG